ncbi:MAG: hypothetical protein IKZ02_03525 [Alphaproteobacteria bacterium]|nr:hypothetical protein [Alphaproteobacteria bacterium]
MKKIPYVFLLTFLMLFALPAHAGLLDSITATIFGKVMEWMGFGSNLDGYCWFCPIFSTLFEAANQLATDVINITKLNILKLLGIGAMFFIIFRVSQTLIKLQEVDLMQFLGDLFKTLGRVLIASAIIAGTNVIMNSFVTPILAYAFDFSIGIMNEAEISNKMWSSTNKRLDYTDNANAQMAAAQAANFFSGQAFSQGLQQSMIAMLAKISANLVVGMAVGIVLIVTGILGSFVFPDIQLTLSGAVIFAAFSMIYLSVPFQLINIVVRLAFITALMPFWVVFWVFQPTQAYTKNALNMLLNVCLTIMTTGVIMVLVFKLIGMMLPDSDDILSSMVPGWDLIAGKKSSVFKSGILITLALGFLCKELIKAAPELASRIIQSYDVSIGSSVEAGIIKSAGIGLGAAGTALGLGTVFGQNSYDTLQKGSAKMRENIGGMLGMKNKEDTIWNMGSNSSKPTTPGQYTGGGNGNQTPAGTQQTPTQQAGTQQAGTQQTGSNGNT